MDTKSMKPILFNTEMVRAILEGRKTETRRVVKFIGGLNPSWTGYIPDGTTIYGPNNIPAAKTPYQPGNILYVRETWTITDCEKCTDTYSQKCVYFGFPKINASMSKQYCYLASYFGDGNMKWKPSIHMPKEAARIFLKVTGVRAEKLQDITVDGAIKEGIRWEDVVPAISAVDYPEYIDGDSLVAEQQERMEKEMLRESFGRLWDSTIKKKDIPSYGWDANPWVWVIEFERCKAG